VRLLAENYADAFFAQGVNMGNMGYNEQAIRYFDRALNIIITNQMVNHDKPDGCSGFNE
jgi:hypothetical protein